MNINVRWMLADCRTQRRYMREDAMLGRGVTVKSAPPPYRVLRGIQYDLARLRAARKA